jgi:hypothetical protein
MAELKRVEEAFPFNPLILKMIELIYLNFIASKIK